MKKTILILCLIVASVTISRAQAYNWALGLRGGVVSSGLTAKFFLNDANAVESIISLTNGVSLYQMYERHTPVISSGYTLYYGGGINVGTWEHRENGRKINEFTAGVNGIIGLEYKLRFTPLAFSLDYTPGINFIGHTGFRGWDNFGIGAKYTF